MKQLLICIYVRDGRPVPYFLFRCPFFIQGNVAKVDQNVQRYDQQIDDIGDQHVIDLAGDQLCGNACNITCNDQQDKGQARALCGFGSVGLDHIQRPGKAKAHKHNCF